MLRNTILEDLKEIVIDLGLQSTDIVLSIPKNPTFGMYSTNLALQLTKLKSTNYKQNPIEIANKILQKFGKPDYLDKIEIAGGGFINFFIKDRELIKNIDDFAALQKSANQQRILIEYGHVNPLKEIHIGHLRTFILGESLCRIYQALGHQVFRANYQGDIGLHIAKAIWGIKKLGLPSRELNLEEKAKFLGRAYAEGNTAYDQDPTIKKDIDSINAALYQNEGSLKEIYSLARSWSLEYFEPIYQLLDIKYDRCFFESEVHQRGTEIVLKYLGKVFEKNDGAIIFPGEKYGLHNRVFITSEGHPTYEAKEIGLAELEYDNFNYDQSIHVVASEQEGYFQVVFKAIELTFPYLIGKKYHLSYGVVDLKEGKMSSRLGNVVTVHDLYHEISEKVRAVMKQGRIHIDQQVVKIVALAAIKYSYLKFSPSPNIVFDIDSSVSLEGDSGPYLQYTYARIQSVLSKSDLVLQKGSTETISPYDDIELDQEERMILTSLMYFQETVEQSASLYHPHLLASYLLELARGYNLFYQGSRIIGSAKENFRLKLSQEVGKVLKKGLDLLGIEAPERM